MDDANLDKFIIKPGKYSPAFHKDTIEYHATLGHDVASIKFQCVTSDTCASYCVLGNEGSKEVQLTEGETSEIKVEVTADDGRTTKIYTLFAKRLSAKDASLTEIKLDNASLVPDFSSSVTSYCCYVGSKLTEVKLTAVAADPKIPITVNGQKPEDPVQLNCGFTDIDIEVTSLDGSNKQNYTIKIYKKAVPFYVRFQTTEDNIKFECPFSLAPLHQPITILGSLPKHTISADIMDEFTKTCKQDPLNEQPLSGDWRSEDASLDSVLSSALVSIPLLNGGMSEAMKHREVGDRLKAILQMPVFDGVDVKYSSECPLQHSVQVRTWEKQLQQIFDETNVTTLSRTAEEYLHKYFKALPKPGRKTLFSEGESPLDYLEHASHCFATAIKNKPQNANMHLQLGLVLEEKYYAEDIFGLKSKQGVGEKAGANVAARESSKEEECGAICKLRGVAANAPLSLQLKAIDEEYHHLLDQGQSGKADHVQGLYVWKSKQATQEGMAAQKAADDQSPLGQAYLKYLDALSLDESKGVHHFHVGRMLVIQGEPDKAVPRLEAALSWNDKHTMAKFYLGLALTLRKDGAGDRAKEAAAHLFEGFSALISLNIDASMDSESGQQIKDLHAGELVRNTNVHLLRGIIQLASLLESQPSIKGCMSPQHIYHNAALFASMALPSLNRGDIYQQVEWVLLDAHARLLEILLSTEKNNSTLIATRCRNLSALIKRSTIPQNNQLLALQKKTCEMLVETQPCNSHALYLLGDSQLNQFDNDPKAAEAESLLGDAKASFRASIDLEDKPAKGDPLEILTAQKWWQDKLKKEEEKKKAATENKAQAAPAKAAAAPTRGGARGKPAPARGGASAGRGASTSSAKTPAAPARSTAPARGGAAARGGRGAGAAGRGAAATSKTPAKPAAGSVKPAESSKSRPASGKPNSASKRPGSAKQGSDRPSSGRPTSARPASGAKTAEKIAVNAKSYQPRLGLARALTRNTDNLSEAEKYYEQVIAMAPEVHDAYIEIAEMLTKTDPMGAVDIYCKFPVPNEPSFDDAYIFGEIVRLLMKAEKYDDKRLTTNLIALGKILGLAALEKDVKILEDKYKHDILKAVYAGVNSKEVDDPDLQAFFKFKCWI